MWVTLIMIVKDFYVKKCVLYMRVKLQILIKSRLCSLIKSSRESFSLRITRKMNPFPGVLMIYNLQFIT